MKKNISINISGIIFHIEEDGYSKLKQYLDSISGYFSSFEGATEITSDIESRIAEIFLSKLTEDKQVITLEDVEALIATMGSIEDFQAIEEPLEGAEKRQEEEKRHEPAGEPKKLYRDTKRKIIGGVCAGMAYYFNVDPLWIRLLTIILFIGSYGILLIAYAVLWAVIPESDEIREDQKVKKMFRNPDDKVLGGVSSGIAMYFGVEATIIRLLFVIFTFIGGTGLIVYIIMWVILPEASSITEKVQMQGEPVTLSNIESNVKRSLNVREGDEENTLVKILLFPFRLIAMVINGLGKAFGPLMLFLVDFIRIIAGVLLTVIGIAAIISLVTILGIFLGIYNGNWPEIHFHGMEHPISMFIESLPPFSAVATVFTTAIPFIFLILLGVSIIAKKIIFNATIGWSLFGVFVISAIFLSVNIPTLIYSYHDKGEFEETRTFNIADKTAILKVDRSKGLNDYEVTNLWIRGHEGPEYKAVLEFSSQGANDRDAIENAKMTKFDIVQQDSVLIFDGNIHFEDEARFKFQELDVTLYIPFDQPFIMDNSLKTIMTYRSLERYGYKKNQIDDENMWVFTPGGLECLNCEREDDHWTSSREQVYSRLHDLRDFDEIEINSPITVEIKKGDNYRIETLGKEEYVDELELRTIGNELDVSFKENRENFRHLSRSRDAVRLVIITPNLSAIELNQACIVNITGFDAASMDVEMNGAARADMDVKVERLDVRLNGNSKLTIEGEGQEVQAELNGNSTYEGYGYRVKEAEIGAHGASNANVYASEKITIRRDFVSKVEYRGGASEVNVEY
ncbi:MAG: PspC domain-containing protein [Cyclobacteriaceae bacterium]|nr:PspC domain-containing protein [Cyclobacteriaceae bacterium]